MTSSVPAIPGPDAALLRDVTESVAKHEHLLIDVRRDLHAHPELSWTEERTASVLAKRLDEVGLVARPMPRGGLLVDIGPAGDALPVVALRADLDALPVDDRTDDPWASTVQGVAHACGHDVHAPRCSAPGWRWPRSRDRLPGRVRLVFQPAEEMMPGGALMAIDAGALDGVSRIFALHVDPTLDVGTVGLREGPLTGASDHLDVMLSGKGGHTSRPHLTEDLTFALGKLVTELPAVLSRRLDPRAGVSVVWGDRPVGLGGQRHPRHRSRRRHRADARRATPGPRPRRWCARLVEQIVEPYGVHAHGHLHPRRAAGGQRATGRPRCSAARSSARSATTPTSAPPRASAARTSRGTSTRVPGAMGRLGTRTPGGPTYDLHQGDLRVDERAISVGATVLAGGRARGDGHRRDNALPATVASRAVGARPPDRIGSRESVPGDCGGTHTDEEAVLRRSSKIAAVVIGGSAGARRVWATAAARQQQLVRQRGRLQDREGLRSQGRRRLRRGRPW